MMEFRDSFCNIQGWMITDLKLTGNELITYAVIYGFCRDGQNWYKLSQEHVARWSGITTRGLRKILTNLKEKGLLKMRNDGSGGCSEYMTIKPDRLPDSAELSSGEVRNSVPEVRNSVPGVRNSVPEGAELSSCPTSNNINNNINNINNTKENKKRKSEEDLKQDFEELWKLYPRKRGKEPAFKHYKRALKEGSTNEEIRQGILNLIEDIRKNKTEERYIPYGSTFFNEKSWNDDMKTETVQQTCGNNKSQEFMDFEPF